MAFGAVSFPERSRTIETVWQGNDRLGVATVIPIQIQVDTSNPRGPQAVVRLNYDPGHAPPTNWTLQTQIPMPWLASDVPRRTADGGTSLQNVTWDFLQVGLSSFLPLWTGVV